MTYVIYITMIPVDLEGGDEFFVTGDFSAEERSVADRWVAHIINTMDNSLVPSSGCIQTKTSVTAGTAIFFN